MPLVVPEDPTLISWKVIKTARGVANRSLKKIPMRRRWWISTVCAAVLLLTAPLITACGIITAPISGPAAVASNMNFSLQGPVVDQDGNPLNGVLLTQTLRHRFWTPIQDGADTDERKLRVIDREYRGSERGATLDLTFTRDGYYDASYLMSAADGPIVTTPYGAWVVKGNTSLPVVMYAREPRDSHLARRSDTLNCERYPKMKAVCLNRMTEWGIQLDVSIWWGLSKNGRWASSRKGDLISRQRLTSFNCLFTQSVSRISRRVDLFEQSQFSATF